MRSPTISDHRSGARSATDHYGRKLDACAHSGQGTAIGLRLKDRGVKVLGLDFNPLAVRRWQDLGLEAQFSDATDPEFVRDLPLHHAAWIVLTVPRQAMGLSHEDARSTLLQLLRTAGFGGKIAGE